MLWSLIEGASDIRTMLVELLLSIPACLFAISAHEAAHGWMAERCGDSTARYLGRITLNPVKHFDPIGFGMMMLFGFGWARPIPVNPRNYRRYRRDDLLVSMAGILMNLLIAFISALLIFIAAGAALATLPETISYGKPFIMDYMGERCLITADNTYCEISLIFRYACGGSIEDILFVPVFGQVAGYLYRIFVYSVILNLSLAFFNLIPIPPLDGYHLLNDLILRKPLFASIDTQRLTRILLLILVGSDYIFPRIGLGRGILSRISGFLLNNVLQGLGIAAGAVYNLFV